MITITVTITGFHHQSRSRHDHENCNIDQYRIIDALNHLAFIRTAGRYMSRTCDIFSIHIIGHIGAEPEEYLTRSRPASPLLFRSIIFVTTGSTITSVSRMNTVDPVGLNKRDLHATADSSETSFHYIDEAERDDQNIEALVSIHSNLPQQRPTRFHCL